MMKKYRPTRDRAKDTAIETTGRRTGEGLCASVQFLREQISALNEWRGRPNVALSLSLSPLFTSNLPYGFPASGISAEIDYILRFRFDAQSEASLRALATLYLPLSLSLFALCTESSGRFLHFRQQRFLSASIFAIYTPRGAPLIQISAPDRE